MVLWGHSFRAEETDDVTFCWFRRHGSCCCRCWKKCLAGDIYGPIIQIQDLVKNPWLRLKKKLLHIPTMSYRFFFVDRQRYPQLGRLLPSLMDDDLHLAGLLPSRIIFLKPRHGFPIKTWFRTPSLHTMTHYQICVVSFERTFLSLSLDM